MGKKTKAREPHTPTADISSRGGPPTKSAAQGARKAPEARRGKR